MSITCVAAMQQAQERIQLLTMPQKQNSQDKPKHKFVADAREIALSALLLILITCVFPMHELINPPILC